MASCFDLMEKDPSVFFPKNRPEGDCFLIVSKMDCTMASLVLVSLCMFANTKAFFLSLMRSVYSLLPALFKFPGLISVFLGVS